jgi:hypothetical protein
MKVKLWSALLIISIGLLAHSLIAQKISGPGIVCKNETNLVYTAPIISGATYAWVVPKEASLIYGQGSNIIIVNWGSKKGSIEVVIRTVNGVTRNTLKIKIGECSASITANKFENDSLSVGTSTIHPNPFTVEFTAEFWSETADDLGTLLLFDASGVLKKKQDIQVMEGKNEIQVDVPPLLPGKYVVYIYYGSTVQKVRAIRGQ